MLGFKITTWDFMTFEALAVIVFGFVLFLIFILGLPGEIDFTTEITQDKIQRRW
jgi:hypothetical protein